MTHVLPCNIYDQTKVAVNKLCLRSLPHPCGFYIFFRVIWLTFFLDSNPGLNLRTESNFLCFRQERIAPYFIEVRLSRIAGGHFRGLRQQLPVDSGVSRGPATPVNDPTRFPFRKHATATHFLHMAPAAKAR